MPPPCRKRGCSGGPFRSIPACGTYLKDALAGGAARERKNKRNAHPCHDTGRVPDGENAEVERTAERLLAFRILGRLLLRASALLAAAAAGMEEAGRRMEGRENGDA